MAKLVARANGNWLDASTWGVAEAGTGAVISSKVGTGSTTLAYAYSSAFTCTAGDVMDGVALFCRRLNTTGTVTIALSEDNGVTPTREVTVDASDLPPDLSRVLFVFPSTLTADGGADYKVGVKASSAANAEFSRDAAANNWTRVIRLTATAAPAVDELTYIAQEWTAAGASTARTVTMNATAAAITSYGSVEVGQGGTLTFGSDPGTDYYLRLAGNLYVYSGGTLNMGTVATPIPATSTAKLNLDCGSNVQYGVTVNNGGTFVAQGASKTCWTYLEANVDVDGTSLTTAVSTSWADNDEIAIASTTRTAAQCEKGTLNGAASGTGLTVDGFGGAGGGVAYAHSGTAPTRAEVINLTRNVQLFGASATYQTYVLISATATVDWDYVECYWLGANLADKYGVVVKTTTGTFSAVCCSFHDFAIASSNGIFATGGAHNNFTVTSSVFWAVSGVGIWVQATSGTAWTLSGNVLLGGATSMQLADTAGTITTNVCVGATSTGISYADSAVPASFQGNCCHSCAIGMWVSVCGNSASLLDLNVWRNNGIGLRIYNNMRIYGLMISGTFTANGGHNILLDSDFFGLTLSGVTAAGDGSFATGYGVQFNGAVVSVGMIVESCSFGAGTAHTSGDIGCGTGLIQCITRNTTLASGTPIAALSTAGAGSYVRHAKYGQVAGDHRTFYPQGTIQTDATAGMFRTASPSERLTPSSASTKLESGAKRKAVDSGGTGTFSVYIRKSVVGDGAAYNGNQPRLVLRKNVAAGISADTVLDTATAASDGDWEQLTGTSGAVTDDAVLEAYIDCDGTAGWVNDDDWE